MLQPDVYNPRTIISPERRPCFAAGLLHTLYIGWFITIIGKSTARLNRKMTANNLVQDTQIFHEGVE